MPSSPNTQPMRRTPLSRDPSRISVQQRGMQGHLAILGPEIPVETDHHLSPVLIEVVGETLVHRVVDLGDYTYEPNQVSAPELAVPVLPDEECLAS